MPYGVERIEPREIPEPKYVPPEKDVKSTPIPREKLILPTKHLHAKYKTFKEHLKTIRKGKGTKSKGVKK